LLHYRTSSEYDLNIRCVQGSVLGPKLFAIYCKDLTSHLSPNAHAISNADDSYITMSCFNEGVLFEELESCLRKHQAYMTSIGMVINKDKKELIKFSKGNFTPTTLLNSRIITKPTMKALGVTFDHRLSWKEHVELATNNAKKTNSPHQTSSPMDRQEWCSESNYIKVLLDKLIIDLLFGWLPVSHTVPEENLTTITIVSREQFTMTEDVSYREMN